MNDWIKSNWPVIIAMFTIGIAWGELQSEIAVVRTYSSKLVELIEQQKEVLKMGKELREKQEETNKLCKP